MAGRQIDRIIYDVIERDTETKVLQENNYCHLLVFTHGCDLSEEDCH